MCLIYRIFLIAFPFRHFERSQEIAEELTVCVVVRNPSSFCDFSTSLEMTESFFTSLKGIVPFYYI